MNSALSSPKKELKTCSFNFIISMFLCMYLSYMIRNKSQKFWDIYQGYLLTFEQGEISILLFRCHYSLNTYLTRPYRLIRFNAIQIFLLSYFQKSHWYSFDFTSKGQVFAKTSISETTNIPIYFKSWKSDENRGRTKTSWIK